MSVIRRFPSSDDLLARERIEIELPRFLVRIFEAEVAKANADAISEEMVSFNDYIELHLAEHVSIADVATLERQIPGVGGAVWRWLEQINES